MKKGILKKLAPVVAVSAIIALSAFGMAGCHKTGDTVSEITVKNNVFIIYNDTLHKGDVITEYHAYEGGVNYNVTPVPQIKTKCGLERGTAMFVESEVKPKADEYDHICEDCLFNL